jgi:hypothetical protein
VPPKKQKKRDINDVRNLPEMEELIGPFRLKIGTFGRIWTAKGARQQGNPLYGSHITFISLKEAVSVFGRVEPFQIIRFSKNSHHPLATKIIKILKKHHIVFHKVRSK